MNLLNDLKLKNDELNISLKSLKKNGIILAEKERDYKIELRCQALKLRSEKAMPVTLIQSIIYGVPEVADLRFKRDVAEATYKANQEAINTIKLQIRILESQISREWNSESNIL